VISTAAAASTTPPVEGRWKSRFLRIDVLGGCCPVPASRRRSQLAIRCIGHRAQRGVEFVAEYARDFALRLFPACDSRAQATPPFAGNDERTSARIDTQFRAVRPVQQSVALEWMHEPRRRRSVHAQHARQPRDRQRLIGAGQRREAAYCVTVSRCPPKRQRGSAGVMAHRNSAPRRGNDESAAQRLTCICTILPIPAVQPAASLPAPATMLGLLEPAPLPRTSVSSHLPARELYGDLLGCPEGRSSATGFYPMDIDRRTPAPGEADIAD
jgi:hypothetical protein